jgi:hypothetical protein
MLGELSAQALAGVVLLAWFVTLSCRDAGERAQHMPGVRPAAWCQPARAGHGLA